MDLTKENLHRVRSKAENRINDWIENCQSAGITRLHDQFGKSTFKRIEYKSDAKICPAVKLKPLKFYKDGKSKKTVASGLGSAKDKDERRGDITSKSPRQGALSRQTLDFKSDSYKKHRDSPSIFREMNNKSSHNRSSFRESVCSMDAISLLVDDRPNDFYLPGTSEKVSLSNFTFNLPDFSDPMKPPKQQKRPKVFERLNRGRADVIHDAEKTFYDNRNVNKFKPLAKKLKKKSGKSKKMNLPQLNMHIAEEDGSHMNNTDETFMYGPRKEIEHPPPLPPIVHVQINTADTPEPESEPSKVKIGQTTDPQYSLTRPPSNLSQIPLTFTIETNTRSKTSLGNNFLTVQSESEIRPSRSDLQIKTTSNIMDTLSKGLKRNKSKLSRINLSATPSSVTDPRSDASSTLLRVASRRFTIPMQAAEPEPPPVVQDKKALERFQKFVRKFIAASRLLNAAKAKMRKQTREEIISVKKEERSNVLDFDVTYFKSATTSYGGLSIRAREALWKNVNLRTPQDISTLREVMDRLPFFHKYSKTAKQELARMLWYDRFEDERIIIRQGDVGSRMYFVVSGFVSLQTTHIDPRTGQKVVIHLKDVKSGATFGELALIRDIKRSFTAVCKGDCEFLSLSKNEFNTVLRHKWEQDWQLRFNFIKGLPCFEGASNDQIKNACDMTEIKKYSDNTVIYGDKSEITDAMFFVKKGKCDMIKRISLQRTQSPYLRPSLFLPGTKQNVSKFMNKSYGKAQRICRTENHMLTVMSLYPGDYFGVGENLKDTFIISNGKVECLLVNSAFYAINLMMDRLDKMRTEIEKKIPPNIELYRRFEENRKWTEYKKNLVHKVVKGRGIPNTTTTRDIPKILTMEPNIPDDLLWTEK